jgi:hypothetical protein
MGKKAILWYCLYIGMNPDPIRTRGYETLMHSFVDVGRYWNQLNEDIRILLQRFDAEYGDESEKKGCTMLASNLTSVQYKWVKDFCIYPDMGFSEDIREFEK